MSDVLQSLIKLDQDLLLSMNGSNSLFWDGIMVVITSTQVWIPMFVVLLYVIAKNNTLKSFLLTIAAIALVILFCDQISSGICKPLFERFRPTQDPYLMYEVDIVNGYRGSRYGFMSSHAANTFGTFVFLSLIFKRKSISIMLGIWAIMSSYSRIYLGAHYLGDILCGCLVGCLTGYLIHLLYFHLNKIKSKVIQTSSRSSVYTKTGYSVSDLNFLLLTILLTYSLIPFIGMIIVD
jgi:undecaprenyl-diphosphatase